MPNNLRQLLLLIRSENYITAKQLAEQLKISMKTVRVRIKELNDFAKDYGVEVVSRPRCGYTLFLEPDNRLEELLGGRGAEEKLPSNAEERTNYLVAYLINYDDYIRLEDLCDFLYVSKSTLQPALRQAEKVLNGYDIQLERKPNYGIKALGEEFDFRRCIVDYFIRRNMLDHMNVRHQEEEIKKLAQFVLALSKKYDIHLSEMSFENFVNQVYVAAGRIRRGRTVHLTKDDVADIRGNEWKFVEELTKQIEVQENITYGEAETAYIVLYLAGRRMIGDTGRDETNFVVREEIDRLVIRMLEIVYEEFKVDFRSNFDIRMILNQHMVPFDIRIRYNIPLTNSLLFEIKENYILAYTMASRAVAVLADYYQKPISDDETGYFALVFALGMEQRENRTEKANILIVCSSGKGSSRLLMYQYKQKFGKNLNHIYACNQLELEEFDFSKVDYVFTTIPIAQKIPVPIVEVGTFLESKDILAVQEVLENGKKDFLDEFYKEENFLTDIPGSTREEVLENLCRRIGKDRELPEGFYDAIMRREQLAQTDFGNYIAIPHPYQVMTDTTFVYVAVLAEPVWWSHHEVQVIFLTSVGKQASEDENLPKFYEATAQLVLKEDAIKELIQKKDFKTLMRWLKQ